ncbi:hypothetical protein NL676_035097 [Syzygium grande]|nr:hypothetical protein NL676_035097 [Syzygium grande]
MPIFYGVTPAEVRHQIGSYKEAFLSHKRKFGENVNKWKAALCHVANLNGWDNSKKDRGEGELTDEIVRKVIGNQKIEALCEKFDPQLLYYFANEEVERLSNQRYPERLPDLFNVKKLNELHLGHCHNLLDVQSIESLGNLRTLKLIEIPLLKRLPDSSNLKKLTELHLRYCCGLTEIKSFEGLENLMMLKLGELPLLERLPNLSNLKKLTQLDLRRCHNLVKIQGRLEALEDLCIKGCRSLDEVVDPAFEFQETKIFANT